MKKKQTKISRALFIFLFFQAQEIFAQEDIDVQKKSEGEISSLEAGAVADSDEAGKPVPQTISYKDYQKKASKLRVMEVRIQDADKNFEALVKNWKATKEGPNKLELRKAMVKLHEQRRRAVIKFNKLRRELSVRYPGAGEEVDQKFIPIKDKSLAEMESESSLSQTLTRVKKTVDRRYAKDLKRTDRKRIRARETIKEIEGQKQANKKSEPMKRLILEK